MTRLVVDAIWRSRWMYVAAAVMMVPFWPMFGEDRSNALPMSVTALSLIQAAVIGPLFAVMTMGVRALRHLPVAKRDLWRATWIVATVVPAGVLLAAKTCSALLVMAFGGSPPVSAEMVLLSAIYDFSWAGALLPLFPLVTFAESAVDYRGGRAAWIAELARGVALIVICGLPILASDALPRHVAEFTPVTTVALIACLAIAFGTLAWTPQRGLLAGERGRPQRAVVVAGAATQTRLVDRLTGIPRIVVPYLLTMVALPVGAWLALASYGVISGSGLSWFVPQVPTVFDPEDTGYRGLTYYVLVPTLVAMQGLWTPWARLMKVLPLSARQINALLLLTPFATWTLLWLLGWTAYVLAYGTPQTLRLEFAFGMAAIGALAHAAQLRTRGGLATYIVITFTAGLTPELLKVGLRVDALEVVFAVIGLIALCTAAFLNHHTLTRSTSSSRAYRSPFDFKAHAFRGA